MHPYVYVGKDYREKDCTPQSIFKDKYTRLSSDKSIKGKWALLLKSRNFGERAVWWAATAHKAAPQATVDWLGFIVHYYGGMYEYVSAEKGSVSTDDMQEWWTAATEK